MSRAAMQRRGTSPSFPSTMALLADGTSAGYLFVRGTISAQDESNGRRFCGESAFRTIGRVVRPTADREQLAGVARSAGGGPAEGAGRSVAVTQDPPASYAW